MKSMRIKVPHKEVVKIIKEAAYRCNLELTNQNTSRSLFEFYKSGNLLSFGNNITVSLTANNSVIEIKVKSESSAPIQLVDWGINNGIEEDLIIEIRKIAP